MPTQKGGDESQTKTETASTSGQPDSGKSKPVNPRDAIIARVAEKTAQSRAEPTEGTAISDPEEEGGPGGESDTPGSEGASATEGGQAGEIATDKDVSGAGDTDADPLAGFVVVQDGKAFVRLKVDGQEKLVSAEKAQATLQKQEAAEVRLQQATEVLKQAKARDEASLARERELEKRAKGQPSSSDADDQDLDKEAAELARSLLTDSEDEVAAKLKKVLSHNRQAKPVIDEDSLIGKAADAAEKRLEVKRREQDVSTGFKRFQSDYPDIANDPKLFAVADGMTTEIATEHPDWAPSEVMLEAGKRTTEWLTAIKGPAAKPATGDRQQRKEQLRPLPQARSARQETKPQQETSQTREQALLEIRKARGQAV